MTIETVPNTDLQYFLLCHDKEGREQRDDPDAPAGGLLSHSVHDALADPTLTDVVLISHGWRGDVPAAKAQYNHWIGAMARCAQDREKLNAVRAGFRPLLIGLHWPSQPWGDEDPGAAASYSPDGGSAIEEWIDAAADRIADSPRARAALEEIDNALKEAQEPL